MVVLICIAFLVERESLEKIGSVKDRLVSTFPFLHQAKQRHPTQTPHKKVCKITFSAETGLSETLLGPG